MINIITKTSPVTPGTKNFHEDEKIWTANEEPLKSDTELGLVYNTSRTQARRPEALAYCLQTEGFLQLLQQKLEEYEI